MAHATEQTSTDAASTPATPTRFEHMVRQLFVLSAFTLIGAPALAVGTADACSHHIPQPDLADQTPIDGKRAALVETKKGTFQ